MLPNAAVIIALSKSFSPSFLMGVGLWARFAAKRAAELLATLQRQSSFEH
jgi:hypothetical protein